MDILNISHSHHGDIEYLNIISISLMYISVSISGLVMCLGCVFWLYIPRFRLFKNYVFIQIIFSGFLFILSTTLDIIPCDSFNHKSLCYYLTKYDNIIFHIRHYFNVVFILWLLSLSIIFYLQIVKVFGYNIKRRYLKSTLFSWGSPLILTIILILFDKYAARAKISFIILLIICKSPLLVNIYIYIKVVYCLVKSTDVRRSADVGKRVQIATLIFFMSGAMILLAYCTDFGLLDKTVQQVGCVIHCVQIILVNIFFLILKTNRLVWWNAIKNICKRKPGSESLC